MTDPERIDYIYAHVLGLCSVARALIEASPGRVEVARAIDASLMFTDDLAFAEPVTDAFFKGLHDLKTHLELERLCVATSPDSA